MTLPKQAVSPSTTKVMLALLDQQRATVRSLGAATGSKTTNNTHRHLRKLRDLDLVAWTDGKQGTLRPLYGEVR